MQGKAGLPAAALEGWEEWRRDELQRSMRNGCVGQRLVSETDKVRVWTIHLKPGERVGFHCHLLDYFWTSVGQGRSRSHYNDGRVLEREYSAGECMHLKFGPGEFMVHDLENIGTTALSFVTVEHKQSANVPLELPVGVSAAA